jgi:predicted NUDIX family NTP pyrophosphohydrolase
MLKSAGILLYRKNDGIPEVLLVHPGGPFWKNKDLGVWSIPKGEFIDPEPPMEAAIRELFEETGIVISGTVFELTPVKQAGGKLVFAWAVEQDADVSKISSNFFEMEWPPKSGQVKSFPEIDKANWFKISAARLKINSGQLPFLHELESLYIDQND